MSSDPTFPATPQQLTAQWLGSALEVPVAEFQVEAFATGVGVIGQLSRLRLRYRHRAGPPTVIAKFAADNPATRALAASYDMYGREYRFYTQLAARVPLRVPRCHYAAYRAEDQSFVLLLEDLAGYRVGDQLAGAAPDDARRVIEALAALHAAFWRADRSDAALAWLPVHDNPAQATGMQQGVAAGWPVVSERLAEVIPPSAGAAVNRLHAAIPRLLQRLCRAPLTLAHADVRLDNLLFDGTEVAMVDWQSVCLSAPEQDVAYFLTQSLADDMRRTHGEALLRAYHAALVERGISDYPLADCIERFRIAALYLVCYAVTIAGTLDMGNARGAALGRALLGRSLRAVDELDAWRLLED